jgi:hypothetical protein
MYMETLRGIAGVGIFPVLSLLVFFVVFGVMLVRVVRMDRASVERFAHLPLDGRQDRTAGTQESLR